MTMFFQGNMGMTEAADDTKKAERKMNALNKHSRHGKKHSHKALLISLISLGVVAIVGGGYAITAKAYETKFIKGTTINGIDVSDMTVEEVEKLVKDKVEDYKLDIKLPDGQSYTLDGNSISLTYVPDDGIQKVLDSQNEAAWITGVFGKKSTYTVSENYSYDSAALQSYLTSLPELDAANVTMPQNAGMQLGDDNQITIVPEVNGNEVNTDDFFGKVTDAVGSGKTTLDLTDDSDFYVLPTVTSTDENLVASVNDMNAFLATTINLTMYNGDTITLDGSTTRSWLVQTEDSSSVTGVNYSIDADTISADSASFIADVASKYDTDTGSMEFNSTNRGTVSVPIKVDDAVGYKIDQTTTANTIASDLQNHQSSTFNPEYSLAKSVSDFLSGTYIEIDLQNQHVYEYVNGALAADSACVSGLATDPDRVSDTGVFEVYWKVTNYTMHGPNNSYSSFVNVAMFYNAGEALHDASWRSSFGGDIYKTSGSHGCINLPLSAAQTFYSLTPTGTPVIVF